MLIDYYIRALRDYANFSGRTKRGEYWYFMLIHVSIIILISLICGLINCNVIGLFYFLATLIPFLSAGVRRMHDVNKDWWYLLIPIYNFVLALTASTEGQNQYGPEPQA